MQVLVSFFFFISVFVTFFNYFFFVSIDCSTISVQNLPCF